MKNSVNAQIAIGVFLVALFVLLLNPMHLWMPTMAHMVILALIFAVVAAFAAFVLMEEAIDEREEMHRLSSGRNAFLLGALVLTVGIIYQGIIDDIDIWLIAALLSMVIGKIVSRWYSQRNM